ncbi:TadE family type IV pilus minor pilin [Actinopolyspora halophila]|uniref:TadE family type IV pilus minor pilin n=1 Tax=Actinopolyspora halophila TaxID=1850 RepID=UPI00035D905A|nr:TadE family type IV pilus minor pilin [Actinopolyspora halophila]
MNAGGRTYVRNGVCAESGDVGTTYADSRQPDPGCAGTASEEGTVTVEAALGICSVVIVFALAAGGLAAVITQLRCTDAAVEIARLTARGDTDVVAERVGGTLPEDADFEVTERGGRVSVSVSAPPVGRLVPGRLSAEAYAVLEPGVNGSVVRKRGTGRERPG